eukprot:6079209-Prymnesium_polylepis.1
MLCFEQSQRRRLIECNPDGQRLVRAHGSIVASLSSIQVHMEAQLEEMSFASACEQHSPGGNICVVLELLVQHEHPDTDELLLSQLLASDEEVMAMVPATYLQTLQSRTANLCTPWLKVAKLMNWRPQAGPAAGALASIGTLVRSRPTGAVACAYGGPRAQVAATCPHPWQCTTEGSMAQTTRERRTSFNLEDGGDETRGPEDLTHIREERFCGTRDRGNSCDMRASVGAAASRIIGTDHALDVDMPLMDQGMDSVVITDFMQVGNSSTAHAVCVQELMRLTGCALQETAVFNAATIRELARFILQMSEDSSLRDSRSSSIDFPLEGDATAQPSRSKVMHLEIEGRWPGGARAIHELKIASGDAIMAVPILRWKLPAAGLGNATGCEAGGFISGAEIFDAHMFRISHVEACYMDPQQRLLLEVGYVSIHEVGLRRSRLYKREVGVFVGMMNTDFATLTAGGTSAYAATGSQ